MEPNKILSSDINDILFEGRNKSYGAYELRRKYNKRIGLALFSTMIVAAAFSAGSIFLNGNSDETADMEVRDVVIENLKDIKPPPPPPPKKETPPPPPEKAPPVKTPPAPKILETTKFTPPVIKKDIEVTEPVVAPVQEITRVDVATNAGAKEEKVITPPPAPPATSGEGKESGSGTGEAKAPPAEDPNKIFEKVEVQASVNMSAWRRHLEGQLQRYIEDAANSGMSAGKYTVQVRFLVEKDGSISDVTALNDPGYGLGKAAVDVVRKGPKWTPGEQNGNKVRSYHTQPITFMITGEM